MRLVLDSSVLIAAVRPDEADHPDARAFVDRLRGLSPEAGIELLAPPELWLEVHVVEQRLTRSRRGGAAVQGAMEGLAITLCAPADREELTTFLAFLEKRMRGRRPFANATDLVYLWVGYSREATVVTLDRGLLEYHGVVCELTRPQHLRFG
jgi:predicted nucleic acid-binding protein